MLTLMSFVFFTGLVGLLTWLLTRRDDHSSSSGYFLAGRTLTGGYIAGSLLLTNLSTEQLVGLNGAAYGDGICVMAWEVIAAVSLVVLGLFYLPRYLKSGIATVPQFLEKRFDQGTRTITTLIFLIAYAVILLPIILYTGARGMTEILDMRGLTGIESEWLLITITVWVIGVIGSIYAIGGGLRTVAVSDTLNGFGLLVGGILIAIYGLTAVNPEGPLEGWRTLREAAPEKFNSIGGPDQSVPFPTLFTGVLLLNLFYWTTNQQIIQRTFGARSLREGQKGVLIAGIFKVLAPMILVLPGIVAFYLYGMIMLDGERIAVQGKVTDELAVVVEKDGQEQLLSGAVALSGLQAESAASALAQAAEQQLPATLTTADGSAWNVQQVLPQGTLIVAGPNATKRYLTDLSPEEVSRVIAPGDRDKSYGRLVQAVLPKWLTGFFAAVVTGAILSSFNSALNSTATLFSLGVYQPMLHPQATERQVILSGRVFGILIAIAAMLSAPLLLGQESIFAYLQDMNAIYFIPIFSVMLVGLLTKRVPSLAAKVALVGSFSALVLGYFVEPFKGLAEQIHRFHFMGLVFATSVGIMLLIGKWKPSEQPWEHVASGDVDLTPWPLAKPIGATLVLFVLTVYIYFADFSIWLS